MREHIILHIDVNSAFLSWSAIKALEEGSTVDLRDIPSIVGGDQETRHGIVVAKSVPAKKYGIKTAETVASAFQKCPTLVTVHRQQSKKLMTFKSPTGFIQCMPAKYGRRCGRFPSVNFICAAKAALPFSRIWD